MTYLLDTCVISELVAKQPNQQVLDWLDAQVPETLYLSVITIGEIAKGIIKITASKRKESLTTWLNETLPNRFQQRILNIDVSTMLLWGNLVAQLELWGDLYLSWILLLQQLQFITLYHLSPVTKKIFLGQGL
ncbi:PIN domain-containing protein [Nostoc sp.]|uniref:PIN domain-containing protein n=1 Tax=Nostoc sp. TaxID=1180 RepID=UPI002FF9264E